MHHQNIHVYHHYPKTAQSQLSYCWEKNLIPTFQEIMVTWNGSRPQKGKWTIEISILTFDGWSPYSLYMQWAHDFQKSFKLTQDILTLMDGNKGIGFKIKVSATDGADLTHLWALHACVKNDQPIPIEILKFDKSVYLSLRGLSQISLQHDKKLSLCSPTSVTAVLRWHLKQNIDPINFAESVLDQAHDIYGNWVLNVAQAVHELGKNWEGWVARLNTFQEIVNLLEANFPVIVSIRGPLAGGAYEYTNGHLVVIRGIDTKTHKVLCMDPAFPTDEETLVSYPLADFVSAWKRRGHVAYVIQKIKAHSSIG